MHVGPPPSNLGCFLFPAGQVCRSRRHVSSFVFQRMGFDLLFCKGRFFAYPELSLGTRRVPLVPGPSRWSTNPGGAETTLLCMGPPWRGLPDLHCRSTCGGTHAPRIFVGHPGKLGEATHTSGSQEPVASLPAPFGAPTQEIPKRKLSSRPFVCPHTGLVGIGSWIGGYRPSQPPNQGIARKDGTVAALVVRS
jgi:hypothetical protein